MIKKHDLEMIPEHFELVLKGGNVLGFPRMERDFEVGDFLKLNEWDGRRTGYSLEVEIISISGIGEISVKLRYGHCLSDEHIRLMRGSATWG